MANQSAKKIAEQNANRLRILQIIIAISNVRTFPTLPLDDLCVGGIDRGHLPVVLPGETGSPAPKCELPLVRVHLLHSSEPEHMDLQVLHLVVRFYVRSASLWWFSYTAFVVTAGCQAVCYGFLQLASGLIPASP